MGVGAARDQRAKGLGVVLGRGPHQCRVAAGGRRVDVGAAGDEIRSQMLDVLASYTLAQVRGRPLGDGATPLVTLSGVAG